MSMLVINPGPWSQAARGNDIEPVEQISLDEGVQDPATTESRSETPPNCHTELFYDCHDHSVRNERESNPSVPSYLVFQPIVESVSDTSSIDWRRYDPPIELLEIQDNMSKDVQDIVISSVKILSDRHEQEEANKAAVARQERPLRRSRRVSARPRLEVPAAAADARQRSSPSSPRSSIRSTISGTSNDSGYGTEGELKAARTIDFVASLFKLQRFRSHSYQSVNTFVPSIHSSQVGGLNTVSANEECVSCLDEFGDSDLIQLICHNYCRPCFQRLVKTSMGSEAQWPPKCCLNPIPSTTILPLLDSPTQRKFTAREFELSIAIGDRLYCSRSGCNTWIPPKHIKISRKGARTARCPSCSRKSCVTCRGSYHSNGECPEDPNLQATIDLAEMEGWKRCYNCRSLVELTHGCRHMTCRCKAQFCYVCCGRWGTCDCSNAQLEAIQQRAIERQHNAGVLTAQELAEEEEARVAVQMVAEYEIAEAARLEHIAEAERLRAQEDRERRERAIATRIARITAQIDKWNVQLETIHSLQKVRIAERQEYELKQHVKNCTEALETLSVRHTAELQLFYTESQQKISNLEFQFQQEYQVLLANERREEEGRLVCLRIQWKGAKEAEYKIREALNQLRAKQDEDFQIWDSGRRSQLHSTSEATDREMDDVRTRQSNEVRAVDGRAQIDMKELRKKKQAEEKWIEEVTIERFAILRTMENERIAHEH